MKTSLLCLILPASVFAAGARAQSDADWTVILRQDAGRVELDQTSIAKGEHGGMEAVVLTVFTRPQKTAAGKSYQKSMEKIEWDCAAQKLWVNATAHSTVSEMVDQYRVPNATPSRFPAPATLMGATARAMCDYFRKNGTGATATSGAPAHDEWETLLKRSDTQVDLNVSSIERGPNGGIQAYVLTMNSNPQTTPDGTEYKNSTEVLEFDCNAQKSWLHGVGYEMNSKLVGVKKYPDAEGFRFMPPMTLGGAIEEAACAYFRRKGLL